jgi:hypothetical protein
MTFYFNLSSGERISTVSEMILKFPAWELDPRPITSWVEVKETTPPEGMNVFESFPRFIDGFWTQSWNTAE